MRVRTTNIFAQRRVHTIDKGKEKQTKKSCVSHRVWRTVAGLCGEPAIDVTFAFKIVNLLLEGQ